MPAGTEEDAKKIKFCQVFIGQTGEDILTQLPDDITWEEGKLELIERLEEWDHRGKSLDSIETTIKRGEEVI